jgi:hypothetical protein
MTLIKINTLKMIIVKMKVDIIIVVKMTAVKMTSA